MNSYSETIVHIFFFCASPEKNNLPEKKNCVFLSHFFFFFFFTFTPVTAARYGEVLKLLNGRRSMLFSEARALLI